MGTMRKYSWQLFGAAGLFGASAYSAYRYATVHKEASEATSSLQGCRCTFNALADKYDKAIGAEETWMGFGILRSWYLKTHAKGSVLEISAGTGRNLPYYNYDQIQSLTLTDLSRPMLQRAEDKFFDEYRLGYKHPDTRIRFAISDAHCMVEEPQGPGDSNAQTKAQVQRSSWWGWARQPAEPVQKPEPAADVEEQVEQPSKKLRPLQGDGGSLLNIFRVLIPGGVKTERPVKEVSLAYVQAHAFDDADTQACCSSGHSLDGEPLTRFPPASFDTVVDTFGLCSHDNPIQVLNEAARVCKPGGKIVLLEHGRGKHDWMNTRLDDTADRHHTKWGCWYNRDIMEIVLQANVVVELVSRWHFGTTYVIIARPAAPHIAASQS